MHAVNHKEITRNALIRDTQGTHRALKSGALDLIRYGNADSDDAPSCKSLEAQHFQNVDHTYHSESSIDKALDFFATAYAIACKHVRNGDDFNNMMLGLYSLGRALHCLQDFYAHSNWIFLNHDIGLWRFERTYLDPQSHENKLFLCYLSPRATQNFDHKPWVPEDINRGITEPKYTGSKLHFKKAKKLSYKNEEDRAEWLYEIMLGPVYHPDLHVDVSFSWASECYKRLFDDHKGYFKAKSLAVEHTSNVWTEFKNDIGADARRLLRDYNWNKLTWLANFSWLRRKFDSEMGL